MIADQRLAEGQAGFGGVADGGGDAGIGHRHDEVGIGRAFARQQAAQILARFLHRRGRTRWNRDARNRRARRRTAQRRCSGRVALARHAFGSDDHHLAGLHVVQVDGADQIEGAGLRGEDVALAAAGDFHLAHGQRTEAVRIARHDDAVLAPERPARTRLPVAAAHRASAPASVRSRRVRHQVQNHFGIAGGLEDGAVGAPDRARSSVALVMLPLCATAIWPLLQATENGCALSSTVSPAVE